MSRLFCLMTVTTLRNNPRNALCPDDKGYLVYNLDTAKLHRLNTTASLILELCQTGKNRAELIDALTPLLGEQSATLQDWLKFAEAEKLLLTDSDPPGAAPAADEFAEKADDLRKDGEILAAYVCQDHATAMQPEPAHWRARGNLAHILGRREDARYSYEQYLQLKPDNAEIRHLLSALLDQPPPQRAPDECIQQLYSRFSSFYEHNMCDQLEYQAPERIRDMLAAVLVKANNLDVLELGCGTGLAAKYLKPYARYLCGIDLSPEMVEQANKTQLYDELAVAEITDYLSKQTMQYDVILACDTLIYFGDLAQIAQPSNRLLRSGGCLIFTVEKGAQPPFKLMDSGRYTHTEEHIRAVAAAAGLDVISIQEGFLRQEYGEPVTGLIAALRRL